MANKTDERPVKKIRRRASPLDVHHLYDAISYWTSDVNRQQATLERIQTFMKNRYHQSEDLVANNLMKCLDDKLILKESRQSVRGKCQGKMVETHCVPTSVERDRYDWYCFECHGKGCVTGCVSCHRVYHRECLPAEFLKGDLKCPECTESELENSTHTYNKETLNKCLGFVCERVKYFVPENVYIRKIPSCAAGKGEQTLMDAVVEPFREAHLIFLPMSMDRMIQKTKENQYGNISEFISDAKNFIHNVSLFHFGTTNCAAVTELKNMLKALEHDAEEIKNCVQCFVNSNEQPDNWYSLPCEPPHALVYAKQKGYCYWPAKVIKKTADGKRVKYDVRFFGCPYERANIEEAFIKPIETAANKLNLKRSAKLTAALDELAKHLELLKTPLDVGVKPVAQSKTEGPPKKRSKTTKKETSTKTVAKVEVEEKNPDIEPELPVEGKADAPPELDANRNSVTSSDNRNLSMEESSEDAVSSSNATNGEVSNNNNDCLEQLRQKHTSEISKIQQAHTEELEKVREEHRQEVERIRQQHKLQLEETKAKIWCCQCFGEAILYCCWQTAYCSKECQHRHWMSDHKLKCRRSR